MCVYLCFFVCVCVHEYYSTHTYKQAFKSEHILEELYATISDPTIHCFCAVYIPGTFICKCSCTCSCTHNLNPYHTLFWRRLYPRYLDMYISNMYIWYVHIRKGTYMIFTYLLICTYLCTRLYGHICISLNVPVFVYT